jgi:hypothetical protein
MLYGDLRGKHTEDARRIREKVCEARVMFAMLWVARHPTYVWNVAVLRRQIRQRASRLQVRLYRSLSNVKPNGVIMHIESTKLGQLALTGVLRQVAAAVALRFLYACPHRRTFHNAAYLKESGSCCMWVIRAGKLPW